MISLELRMIVIAAGLALLAGCRSTAPAPPDPAVQAAKARLLDAIAADLAGDAAAGLPIPSPVILPAPVLPEVDSEKAPLDVDPFTTDPTAAGGLPDGFRINRLSRDL